MPRAGGLLEPVAVDAADPAEREQRVRPGDRRRREPEEPAQRQQRVRRDRQVAACVDDVPIERRRRRSRPCPAISDVHSKRRPGLPARRDSVQVVLDVAHVGRPLAGARSAARVERVAEHERVDVLVLHRQRRADTRRRRGRTSSVVELGSGWCRSQRAISAELVVAPGAQDARTSARPGGGSSRGSCS